MKGELNDLVEKIHRHPNIENTSPNSQFGLVQNKSNCIMNWRNWCNKIHQDI